MLALFFFLLFKNINAQDWIKETPTGKVSVWVTQLEPKDSLVFELMIINGSEKEIRINPFLKSNDNFPIIYQPKSKAILGGSGIYCGGLLNWSKPLPPKTFRKWNVDMLSYLGGPYRMSEGNYSISWTLGSSIGTFEARPVKFYFEK